MAIRYLFFLSLIFCAANPVQAQFADSLVVEVGTTATYSSKDFQPLWITANKFGTIADRKDDVSTNVHLTNTHRFKSGKIPDQKPFYLKYGLNAYNNQHFNKTFVEEGYLKAGYKKLEFRAGRFEETSGDIDPELSSGSLGISGNSLPIPKVGFAVTDYVAIPYTKGLLSFKGQISHGWMGNDRYMKDAFYHEKIFYMQLGKKKFKLYGGVQHFVEWGGKRGDVQLERSWKGFFDVLFVREADDGSVGTAVNGLPPNRPGDQRGLLEIGFNYENDKFKLNGYNQTPFETGRDVDLRNVDRLIGVQFCTKKTGTWLQKITVEVLNTKDMLSFVEISDRQSFYNNGFYKTGWEYQDKIIGTPLFLNRVRAGKFLTQYIPYNWDAPGNTIYGNDNIINNRVVALHIGLLARISSVLTSKTLFTQSKNYGTHSTQTPFIPSKNQSYALQQIQYKSPMAGLTLVGGVGFDTGELYDNTGFMLGIKKQFNAGASKNKKAK